MQYKQGFAPKLARTIEDLKVNIIYGTYGGT